MAPIKKAPSKKPNNPNFSSGPCSKRPGYQVDRLNLETLGRSHRAAIGKKPLELCCTETARLLGLPKGYRVGVVAGSDTGAMEMAMWSLLGQRAVDIFAWESFGKGWVTDITKQLKLENVSTYEAEYGLLPDFSQANSAHDIVFTWNGTTSGVKVPNGHWISDDRTGLTICDAISPHNVMIYYHVKKLGLVLFQLNYFVTSFMIHLVLKPVPGIKIH